MKLKLIENNGYAGLPDTDEFQEDGPPCPLCGQRNIAGYGFLFEKCRNCDTGYCFNCQPRGKHWKAHEMGLLDPEKQDKRDATLDKFETTLEERPGRYYRKPFLRILKCPACN